MRDWSRLPPNGGVGNWSGQGGSLPPVFLDNTGISPLIFGVNQVKYTRVEVIVSSGGIGRDAGGNFCSSGKA